MRVLFALSSRLVLHNPDIDGIFNPFGLRSKRFANPAERVSKGFLGSSKTLSRSRTVLFRVPFGSGRMAPIAGPTNRAVGFYSCPPFKSKN